MLLDPSVSPAAEFTVTQIADESYLNREPVISETGLAAWSAFKKGDADVTSSDLYIYENGKARALVRSMPADSGANIRPQVQGNTVVWISYLPGGGAKPNWIFREVPSPDRDTPVPELPAIYNAWEDPSGKQHFEAPSTNVPAAQTPPAEPAAPVDTNAPPPAPPVTYDTAVTNKGSADAPGRIEPAADKSKLSDDPRRGPSGDAEVCMYTGGENIARITRDGRNDFGPSVWGRLVAWQKAKGWPFGWEIMAWSDGTMMQLTTNYYYDMAPKVQGSQVAWYGWDGRDFEIFVYDNAKGTTTQITSNQYDDVGPFLWDNVIVWEGYAGVDADVFLWRDGNIQKLSDNIEDDLSPRIWNGQVVWQGFDGDDFEIYLFDGAKTIKLTSNMFDDVNPDIRDNVICWMGYHDNWDSEIFVWDGANVQQLTDNEYEDREPHTAGGRIIWQCDQDQKSLIYLAEPKK